MTILLDIKPYIHDFIEDNLDISFVDKVYWLGERKNIPGYPYCLLNVIAENKDKRTSHYQGDTRIISYSGSNNYQEVRENITTRYKTCTITVGVYNAWVEDTYDTSDMDVAKEFAYEQIDNLEGAFENYPINNLFSIQGIGSIRPLHEVVDGGYMYRYEFDLTIGYNEPVIINKNFASGVEVKVVDKTIKNDYIETDFKVTISNNDNIVVETT